MTEIEKTAVEFIEWWSKHYIVESATQIHCPYIKALYIAVNKNKKEKSD